ncbi:hypothetical protein H9Q72_013485 [Fusarium xylarioides]|uniref:Rhodopsin domain-containing protein n=1 Tax=Fusarium xylarioides TaxID=221167 RepID=A0A9P7HCR1_9HYPO|nr:hypothetical protein H9Q72_013485 [Fusarium xylarioides]
MDFILAGFPWVALHGLKMKPKERRTIYLSLSMGVFAGICGVFRTTGLTSLRNSQDYLYAISDSAIWTASEVTATIVCLTFLALRPLYKKIRNQESSSAGYQQYDGSGFESDFSRRHLNRFLGKSAILKFGTWYAVGTMQASGICRYPDI